MNLRSIYLSLGVATAIFTQLSGASLTQPDEPAYHTRDGHRIRYVFDATQGTAIEQLDGYLQTIRQLYDQSFGWQLDEREDFVLLSGQNQVANAFTTFQPNLKTFWYPSGAAVVDLETNPSWGISLGMHESSHLYQLNAKGAVPEALKSVFGSSVYILPFIWPVVIHPNNYTPTFLVEGNAVLNESRGNWGGRLYNGEVRALVLAQIQAGEITPTRLTNTEFRYPFGTLAYDQGGYFEAFLAGKYGIDATNHFFVEQGDHYLWPLILSKTFEKQFAESYRGLISDYVQEWQPQAAHQQYTFGRPLVDSTFIGPLNHDEQKIYFMAGDGLNLPRLYTFDKTTRQFAQQTLDLPIGKVFWQGDIPEAVSSEQIDLHHKRYTLFAPGDAYDERYLDQVVADQRAGRTVALKATDSWLEYHVLLDGETYDVGSSAPILDTAGNVYYFRQNGAERLLYKNRQPLFKYSGYYGKLTEVDGEGNIYFIAATDYGSSLFEYHEHEILRVLQSDRVSDARRLDADHFLVSEIHPSGGRIFINTSDRKPASPVLYAYSYSLYNLQPQASQLSEERTYNSLYALRYSSLDFIGGYSGAEGASTYVVAHWNDPLQYQALSLGFSGSQHLSKGFFAEYDFSRFLPMLTARYVYEKAYWTDSRGYLNSGFGQQAVLSAQIPLWLWRHWSSNILVGGIYSNSQSPQLTSLPQSTNASSDGHQSYESWTSWSLHYDESPEPNLGFWPYRHFFLNFQNQLGTQPDSWKKEFNTSIVNAEFQQGFPLQFYAKLSGNVAWGENHDVLVEYNPNPLTWEVRIPRLTGSSASFETKNAEAVSLEVTKVFNTPVYSSWFPLGLDRIAPFVTGQSLYFDNQGTYYGSYPDSIFEAGFGADFQLLLAHVFTTRFRLMQAYDTRHFGQPDTQGYLDMHYTF
jgi:hypothetical protein